MSVRYEFIAAGCAATEVVHAGVELGYDTVTSPLALLVAGDEVTVIEGSGEELQALLTRAMDQVRAAMGATP
ncbi:hypothetical protein ATK17_3787 [Branchiibius hedensis]|uniref:Uncharacterized protein n=1 Tax=Branchiibius hedensis TaxID=672460 RepID=A0A2Y9BMR1_9MICO|nr:hypothetical protein [Branchiibius hedensis]PWJ23294.1 hypothetical protein ATK17_3787 [Branchiibius hedensis]SSA58983.1 hypothetical protein SAMN04489750_3787 [Branchiibius hedensis]